MVQESNTPPAAIANETHDRLYDYKLNERGIKEVRLAKIEFSDFQQVILGRLNGSREKSIVKTKLEEASFYMTRAIAQSKENHSGTNVY